MSEHADNTDETNATDNQPVEEIVITPASVRQLREELVQADELERTAFIRCARSGPRLLVVEVRTIPDDKMERQGRAECRPDLEVERREIHQAVDAGWNVLHIHSHPFSDLPHFSSIDRNTMPKVAHWTEQMYGDNNILFAVLGRTGIEATWYDSTADEYVPIPVTVLGDWDLEVPLQTESHMHSTEDEQQEGDQAAENISPRYDRNIRTFGAEGQRRLREAEVTVVGVSGLGGIIAEQSARVGVEKINLIDPDHIEKTNLPRVYGAYDSDVGETKVNTVGEHIKQINPDIEVTMHETVVESDDMDTVLKRSDAVIAGLDRMQSRSYLNQFCVRHGIPYFDAGVVIHTEDDSGAVESMDGFLQTIIPGTTACFDCLNRIDPQQTRIERLPEEDVNVEVDEGYVDGTALTPEPAVVTLNTTVAGMAVSELVGYITRIRPPRGFIHYEALSNEISLLDARGSRRQSCPTCGDEGILFHGEVMEPSDTELPDAVDDDLSSIPGPDQPTGDTTDVAEDAEAVQDGGTTTATSPDGHNPTTADTPSSAVEEGPESRPDALTKAMRALSNYVEEVLPWRH